MANSKISALTALTTPDAADVYPIVDTSASETKKITQANLETAIATGAAFEAAFNANTDVQPLTTKGDIYTRSTIPTRLSVGVDGQILSADSTEATGLKWIDAPAGGGGGSGGSTVTTTTATGTTLSLTTLADEVVTVWAKGVTQSSGSDVTIDLKYNGVIKDTVVTKNFSTNNYDSFSLEYTEIPGAATHDITVVADNGALVNVVIIAQVVKNPLSISTCIPRPAFSSSTYNNVQLATNTIMTIGLVEIPFNITLTQVSIGIITVNTSGNIAFVVYSEDGQTKYIDDVAVVTTTGLVTTTISSTTLPAGNYYLAFHPIGTADIVVEKWAADSDGNLLMSGPDGVYAGTLTITANTTPATITPTSITIDTSKIPAMRFDA